MQPNIDTGRLAASITRAASLQTYYTIRFLVDRDLVSDAYRAYAYFRWVDDWLDEPARQKSERMSFVARQKALIDSCYSGRPLERAAAEEQMLIDLVRRDLEPQSGLQSYVRNMMTVMSFDARRRGRLISEHELIDYERSLAVAVTEALHYFIGHGAASPHDSTRYLAVEAAHITHMLRDTFDDVELGYFNIPHERVIAKRISPQDIEHPAYRAWVRERALLARKYFAQGRDYLTRVQNLRCRLAGYAYIARFEAVLDAIERDGYLLRPDYPDAKGTRAGAYLGWSIFRAAFNERRPETG